MPSVYLPFSHTARADGETDSTMRRCVPQPSAIARGRYHDSYYALRSGAGCDGREKQMADVLRVVGPVPQDAVRAIARPTTRSLERQNAIEQW